MQTRNLLVVLFLSIGQLGYPAVPQDWVKSPVYSKTGMVVSTDARASQIGVDILQHGGNAIDAAVATAFALAVLQPFAGNIGGGGFMLIRTADGNVTAIDYREKAPLGAREDMYLDQNGRLIPGLNHKGHLAVGVPGTVAGLCLALEEYGSMALTDLLQPAIALAERGFALSYFKCQQLAKYADDFREHTATAEIFLRDDGEPFGFGDLLVQKQLAATLTRIAANGRDEFYRGETARLIAQEMREHKGIITEKDLELYKAVERAPVAVDYRGFTIYSMPPPSAGGITLAMILNILEGSDLSSLGHNSAAYLHLLAEAMRRGYAARAEYLGDPDFNPEMPLTRLLSKAWAAQQRKTIRTEEASVSSPATFDWPDESNETTHFCVADAEGNVVSNTFTLEGIFGAKIVVAGAGFFLNGEMGDFNAIPGQTDTTGLIGTPPNRIAPGKRMLSSMTPTIVTKDGGPFLAVGSPGGRKITNTVLQIILNIIDFGMNVYQAVDAPRVHHQWLPDVLQMERPGFSRDSIEKLRSMGHRVAMVDPASGVGRAMAIMFDPVKGLRMGAADPRSPDGAALAQKQASEPESPR